MPSSGWACSSSNKLKATSAPVKAPIQIWVSASIGGEIMSNIVVIVWVNGNGGPICLEPSKYGSLHLFMVGRCQVDVMLWVNMMVIVALMMKVIYDDVGEDNRTMSQAMLWIGPLSYKLPSVIDPCPTSVDGGINSNRETVLLRLR